ncbi:MAG: Na+/H+ antiporter NhaA [Bryobacterales bacterium]|nr:Na+/H+ antiporter NhaA [Bryobacterales bacterium]
MTFEEASRPRPIVRILRPFQLFLENDTSIGILLLAATVLALVFANSPLAPLYNSFWHMPVSLTVGPWSITHELHFWVNDLLMAIFFFVVGLEIKREVLVGELASPRQAALPIVAALGGVIVPASIYAMLNMGGVGAAGWGVPMATDIAFALGAMALLGSRVPVTLKVFLTALAIVDDIAAVLVIAVFYTSQIHWAALGYAAMVMAALLAANWLGVRHPLPFGLLGILLWFAVLNSGVHATIAGVLLAMTIPSRTVINPDQFLADARSCIDLFEQSCHRGQSLMADEAKQSAVHALENACEEVQPPLHRMEHSLHPWVMFVIMPIFALANAGVVLDANSLRFSNPVVLGVVLGLMLGKPIGITLASWLAVRSGLASLPAGVSWAQIHGAGWLGGIGFTMSLFVASLAFQDEGLLTLAKLGILAGSTMAGVVGAALLVRAGRR